jgi:hypothetical protein
LPFGFLVELFLSLDLNLNIQELFFEGVLEDRLDLIETFLHLLQCFLFEQNPIVVLFKMLGQMIQVLKLLLVQDIVHLGKDWSVFLLQNVLINLELLLAEHQALMLLVNLVHQSRYQLLKLAM